MRNNNHKDSRSQLCTFLRDSYLDRTSRPIYALAYLTCFIILYEIGTILINPEVLSRALAQPQIRVVQIRVVAFVWVQNLLEYLGFSPRLTWLTTPLVVVIILLALQVTSRSRWYVRVKDFMPMTIECILLAVPLIVLSLLVSRSTIAQPHASAHANQAVVHSEAIVLASTDSMVNSPSHSETSPSVGESPAESGLLVDIVTGIGAGIYEELVFRLILICLLILLFQDVFNLGKRRSIILSVLISAVLFSVHHHIFIVNGSLGLGEAFSLQKFFFRMLAGVYFAVIFAIRGFGITAGTHAFYDIIAAVLNAFLFTSA